MSRARRIRLWAAGLLAAATALSSLLGLVALNTGGRAQVGPVVLLRLAAGADRRADALLSGPKPPSVADRARAADLSREAISQYPYDLAALLRLAYLDAEDHGGPTPLGLGFLRRSYDLAPADPALGLWRIQFALQNYGRLPPDLRQAVKHEVEIQWRSEYRREPLSKMVGGIRDPAGRIMLALWTYRLGQGQTI